MTHAEAFANVQRELNGQADEVAEGWLTCEQWATATGQSNTNAGKIIKRAVEAGKMEAAKFRIISGGSIRAIPHYRIVEGK